VIADTAVRLATLSDAQDIAAMSREYIEHGLPWGWRAGRVARAIRDADTNVVVVGAPGAIVAFGIMSYPDDDAHLLLFAVRRSSQRRGIGSAILRWLEAAARAAGAKRIRVEARRENVAARSFYSEHGYHERVIAKGMYSGVVDGIRLEKWLRPDA
jgi:ribosomal-protein-alanine N-acetyltransferase